MQDVESHPLGHTKIILIHWKKLIFGAFFGLLLGSIAYVLLPSKWESVPLIRIGDISVNSSASRISNKIEELPVVIERLKSLSFVSAAIKNAGRPELAEVLKKKNIKLKKFRRSNVLEMKIRASTPELANVAAEAMVNQLISRHNNLIQEVLRRSHSSQIHPETFKENEDRMKVVERMINKFQENGSSVKNSQDTSWRNYAHQAALSVYIGMLHNYKNTQHLVSSSRPTNLIESINTSPNPVHPKLFFTLLIGMLIGLIFSAGFIYSRPRS